MQTIGSGDIAKILLETADRIVNLADRIDKGGTIDLTIEEQGAVRIGLSDWVSACHREATIFFLTGNHQDYLRSTSAIEEIMRQIEDK